MAPAFRTDHTKRAGLDAVALADGDEHVVTSALIAPSRRAPSQARRFVEQSLCLTHARDAENALLLAASEMATQTVLGGQGPFEIALGCRATVATLALTYTTDSVLRDDRIRLADDVAARVVDGVSLASGVDVVAGRQRLWCVIPTGFVPLPSGVAPGPER